MLKPDKIITSTVDSKTFFIRIANAADENGAGSTSRTRRSGKEKLLKQGLRIGAGTVSRTEFREQFTKPVDG
jgi:hypothetical protein